MHNVRCANSMLIKCECSCNGSLHGRKGTAVKKFDKPDEANSLLDLSNMFCSGCGNIIKPAKNIVFKENKTFIKCPHCGKEWKC